MDIMTLIIVIAGILNLILITASFFIPAKLNFKENMATVPLIIRQIFTIQHKMIALFLVWVSLVCFFFASELTGGSPLGKMFTGFMVVFWSVRFCIQTFYFDREIKKKNPLVNIGYSAVFVYQAVVFALAFLEVPL